MRDYVTFILNNEVQTFSGLAGDTTLLAWLRRTRGLTGSKEGCAEGDCGACTVVVARPDNTQSGTGPNPDGTIIWRPVNACILFMGMLEGASVTTIEGLSDGAGGLHPCQQAMVDFHASQCGFCTPGFVMSLFAAWCNGEGLQPDAIDDTLAGNLCRCTGYRPIVDAGLSLASQSLADHSLADHNLPAAELARRQTEAKLMAEIAHDQTVRLADDDSPSPVAFVAPAAADEFTSYYADNPDATIVSGATDIGLWVTKQQRHLPVMLWTGRVAGFTQTTQMDDHQMDDQIETGPYMRIGPAVTHQQILSDLALRWPDFAEVMRRFGSLQVRSSGTICGNIANGSPIGDLPPMLIALSAEVELTHGPHVRRLPLAAFFRDYGVQDRRPGEYVSAILLPLAPAAHLRCYKISKRFDQDISAVMGAFTITVTDNVITGARLAFGGMAATPKRATHVEAALAGAPFTAASFRAAAAHMADDFTPISDMRASAAYRLQVARNLVVKYGLDLNGAGAVRLAGQSGLALVADGGG